MEYLVLTISMFSEDESGTNR